MAKEGVSWERFTQEKQVDPGVVSTFNEWASGDFAEHGALRAAPCEYYWYDDKGNRSSVMVKEHTSNLRELANAEFIRGANREFRTYYRGGVMVHTNDPRLAKQVQKDPGPMVWCIFPNGKSEWLKVPDFLAVINRNRAKYRDLSVRNTPRMMAPGR